MSNDREMIDLIIKFVKAKNGRDISDATLKKYKHDKLVGFWWDALTYFGDSNFYLTLPDPNNSPYKVVYVRIKKGEYMQYMLWNKEWKEVGELTEDMYQ